MLREGDFSGGPEVGGEDGVLKLREAHSMDENAEILSLP